MAHIAGVDLPKVKRIVIGLTYVFGIGKSLAQEILKKAGINEDKKVQDLSTEEEKMIREIVQNDYMVEGELRAQRALDIKRLMEIGSYRGLRHKKGMPVRGQRTHTNAKTRRGRRKGKK